VACTDHDHLSQTCSVPDPSSCLSILIPYHSCLVVEYIGARPLQPSQVAICPHVIADQVKLPIVHQDGDLLQQLGPEGQ